MPGGGNGISSTGAAIAFCEEETVATNFHKQPSVVELPLQQVNQSSNVRKTPAVEAAESLSCKCAQVAYRNWKGSLVKTWETSDDDMCVLHRKARHLKLPAMKRTVSVEAASMARGQAFGLTIAGHGSSYVASSNKAIKDVVRHVAKLLEQEDPTFTFTSLQIGLNARSLLHCDKNNVGLFMDTTIGPFEGGHLTYYSEVDGTFAAMDTRRWNAFGGRLAHQVMPYYGDRIAVIAYTHSAAFTTHAKQIRRALEDDGFSLPENCIFL